MSFLEHMKALSSIESTEGLEAVKDFTMQLDFHEIHSTDLEYIGF